MTVHITDEMMTLETGNRVVATARFSEHAAANGNGAWIVSTYPRPGDHGADRRRRWGERYPDSHPLIAALREELR